MKKIDQMTKEELVSEVKNLRSRKKYGLVWENKPEKVVDDCTKKLPVLIEDTKKNISADKSSEINNLIIEGDNYHSLSVLNYTHKGKVDVIYIDPPYNTGNTSWVYNNKYVDSNDQWRHSNWLSFMKSRLQLSRDLLTDDGYIVATIDDYELFSLGLLMDDVFGEQNRAGVIVVENNPRGRTSNRFFATSHEYYLLYAKDVSKARLYNLPLTEDQKQVFKYEDAISKYRKRPLRKSGASSRRKDRPKQFFSIYINPKTLKASTEKSKGCIQILPIDNTGQERVWINGIDTFRKFAEDGTLIVEESKKGYSLFVKDRIKAGRKPRSVWVSPKYDTASHGANLLLKMFGSKVFDYPKSVWAVKDFLYSLIGDKPNATVLDYFAGSGTTGHALLELIKEDSIPRRFIVCTNDESNIANDVTYPRIKKVIEGYADIQGIPANLKYFKTDFVDKQKVSDDTRRNLVVRATEMICVKENTFEKKYDNKKFKIYTNKNSSTGILYELDAIDEFKQMLEKIGLKTSIYVFSLTHEKFTSDFSSLTVKYKLTPIPESILEVYRKLFG